MKNKIYLNNKELYIEIIISKALGNPTRKLTKMFQILVERVNRRFFYKNESDRKDCSQEALYRLFLNWHLYDENITDNPFAYFTEIVKRAHAKGFNDLHPRDTDGNYMNHISMDGFYEDGKRDLIL